jgi:hypothetical protein
VRSGRSQSFRLEGCEGRGRKPGSLENRVVGSFEQVIVMEKERLGEEVTKN